MDSLPDLAGLRHAQKDEVIYALWDLVTALRKEVVELKAEVVSLKAGVPAATITAARNRSAR